MPRRKIRPSLDVDITWNDVQNKPSNIVTGSGTSGKIAKFSGTNTIVDSVMTETSNGVQIETGKTLILNGYGLDWDGVLAKYPYISYLKDHFTTPNRSGYWDGWDAAPQWVYYNDRNHFLRPIASGSQTNTTCFLYKTENPINLKLSTYVIGDVTQLDCGIRIDNGYKDNNNEVSFEIMIKCGVGTYSFFDSAIYYRVRNGATITEGQLSSTFPSGKAFGLELRPTSNFMHIYFQDEGGMVYAISIPHSLSGFTRHGLFIRNRGIEIRSAHFHWYVQW